MLNKILKLNIKILKHLGWLVSGENIWCLHNTFVSIKCLKHFDISSFWTSSNQLINPSYDIVQHCFLLLLLSFDHIESQERFSDNIGPGFLWGVFTLSACHWLCLEKVGPNIMTMISIYPWSYILKVGDPCVRIQQIILVFRLNLVETMNKKGQ